MIAQRGVYEARDGSVRNDIAEPRPGGVLVKT